MLNNTIIKATINGIREKANTEKTRQSATVRLDVLVGAIIANKGVPRSVANDIFPREKVDAIVEKAEANKKSSALALYEACLNEVKIHRNNLATGFVAAYALAIENLESDVVKINGTEVDRSEMLELIDLAKSHPSTFRSIYWKEITEGVNLVKPKKISDPETIKLQSEFWGNVVAVEEPLNA